MKNSLGLMVVDRKRLITDNQVKNIDKVIEKVLCFIRRDIEDQNGSFSYVPSDPYHRVRTIRS